MSLLKLNVLSTVFYRRGIIVARMFRDLVAIQKTYIVLSSHRRQQQHNELTREKQCRRGGGMKRKNEFCGLNLSLCCVILTATCEELRLHVSDVDSLDLLVWVTSFIIFHSS